MHKIEFMYTIITYKAYIVFSPYFLRLDKQIPLYPQYLYFL